MRSRMYDFYMMISNIERIWASRNVEDATAEPEWEDYENFLYIIAEWVCGERNFQGLQRGVRRYD